MGLRWVELESQGDCLEISLLLMFQRCLSLVANKKLQGLRGGFRRSQKSG
jgi:hypothetical protein